MIEDAAMGKKTGKGNTPLVAFRLDPKLVKRIDEHAKRMQADHPGLTFTRADAVRELLTRALDMAEGVKRGKG